MLAIGKTFWTVFEEFDEAISPGLYFRVGIARDIAYFIGVFVQVEKVFFTRLRIPDVFVDKGDVYDIPPTTIRPQARHKGELTKDIKVAFTTEASARMAAENGLGQMFVAGDDVDEMTDKVRRFNRIRKELGLPPDQPTTLLWMYCAETEAEAEEGWTYFQWARRGATTSPRCPRGC